METSLHNTTRVRIAYFIESRRVEGHDVGQIFQILQAHSCSRGLEMSLWSEYCCVFVYENEKLMKKHNLSWE